MVKILSKFLIISIILTSCSKNLYVSSGAKSNEPLIFNNEYNIQDLEEITETGKAFWGIPSYNKKNNNRNLGLIFTFNGVQVFQTHRIFPVLTLLSYTAIAQPLIATSLGINDSYSGNISALILSMPIAGTLNNLTWNNSAISSATKSFNYRLVSENPDIDLFFYPKYEISKENVFSNGSFRLKYLWVQDATIKGRVLGATLKRD